MRRLCGSDGLYGALVYTGSAIRAFFGIDHVGFLPFADRALRADIFAGSATNTFQFIDLVRHSFSPLLEYNVCVLSADTQEQQSVAQQAY